MVLWVLNLLTTFGVFAAVTWALYETRHPSRGTLDRANWLLWSAVHLGIALTTLMLLATQISSDRVPGVHIIVLKLCLAIRLMVPWNRRSAA